jgi:penicillin-binding protein 1A
MALSLALLATACRLPQLRQPDPRIPRLPQTSFVYDDHGRLITSLHAGENRVNVPLSQVPWVVRKAVVAIEDERFWEHHGVDLKALVRAAYENARAGRIVQGGSTITEQLIKNTITGSDRTIDRKVQEAILAYRYESTHTKVEILEQYLNTVYFGHGAYGIQAAAKTYFSRPARNLTLPEAALLAGLIASPSRFDPLFAPKLAVARRNIVLEKMKRLGYLDDPEYEQALHSKLGLKPLENNAPYPVPNFIDYVKQWFLGNASFGATRVDRYNKLFEGGLRIYTTLDLRLQKYAEAAVKGILPYKTDPYGAMTVLDPRNGAIRAMVGGRNYFSNDRFSKVNLATGTGGSGRQAGSSFKPFALVAALENGIPPEKAYNSPPSIQIPLPGTCQGPSPTWDVRSYDSSESGRFTLEQGTIDSINVVYAQVIQDLGNGDPCRGGEKVVEVAKRMGITTPLLPVPSAVLGTNPVNTLEMASAYGTLATIGQHTPPIAVSHITDAQGRMIYQAAPNPQQVVAPGVAWTANQILQKVIQEGTGTAAAIGRPEAGKTGTAQQWRDAWFIGFIPQLVAAVWVGFPQGEIDMVYPRVRLPHVLGGTFPAQIWHAFMVNATRDMPVLDFQKPNVRYVTVRVDVSRGCLPNQYTLPNDIREVRFIAGTQPKQKCKEPSGPQIITVPSVVGLLQEQATRLLQGYAFNVDVVTKEDTHAKPGTVISQDPAAGSQSAQGSTIVITVAAKPPGSTPATIPNVIGLSESAAVSKLKAAGFQVAVVKKWECHPAPSCGAEPGKVWQQNPPGGVTAETGSTVTIWVNRGG